MRVRRPYHVIPVRDGQKVPHPDVFNLLVAGARRRRLTDAMAAPSMVPTRLIADRDLFSEALAKGCRMLRTSKGTRARPCLP